MMERRFKNRYLCADLVKLDWIVGEDDFRSAEGVLEDIAAPGACVQVEEPIALGTTLMFTLGETVFSGHVCYCVFREYGYFVGVRFSEESEWSGDSAAPQHLVDLREIAHQAGMDLSAIDMANAHLTGGDLACGDWDG
jgi:hypothetical protein